MSSTERPPVAGVDDRPPARRMRSDAARNRELLMTAGRELFARRGLDVSLDEIAAHAGVGVGTAYRHFANKVELGEAIVAESIDQVAAAAHRALESDDPWDGLVEFLEAAMAIQDSDRGLRLVLSEMYTPNRAQEAYEILSGPIRGIVGRSIASGAAREDLEVSDIGCILAMLSEVSDIGGETAPTLWRRYFPMILATLRPGGPELPVPALTEQEFRTASDRRLPLRA